MIGSFGVGIGAGLVSAVLFAVVITGSPAAILLSYLSPLPIFIAAMGWHHRAGLVACLVGAAASAIAFNPSAGLAYGIGLALPAWWLGYIALLGRESAGGKMEWYPLGRLLLWIVGVATLVTFTGALALGTSFDAYRETMRKALSAMLKSDGGAPLDFPGGLTEDELVSLVVSVVPVLTAASFVPMQAFNLWLAARVVAVSGRLRRPWPRIAATAMPRFAVGLLAAAIAVDWVAGGFPGLIAQALTGALLAAFALQGLAAVHFLTATKPARSAILIGLYVLVALFLVWMIPLLAVLGIIDALARPREKVPPDPLSHDPGI